MSHDGLTALPLQIVRGTSVDYTRTDAEFTPPDWDATLYIAGPSALSQAATDNGSSYDFALSAAQTQALLAGYYIWEERVTNGTKVYTIATGTLQIVATPAGAAAGALQSARSKELAAVEAAIAVRLGIGGVGQDVIDSYSVGTRQVTKMDLRQLYDLRAALEMAVRRELFPGQMGPQYRVTFSNVNHEEPAPWRSE